MPKKHSPHRSSWNWRRPLAHLGQELYPELHVAETHQQRHGVFKIAQRRLFRNWWAWVVALPVTLGLVGILYLIKLLLIRTTFFVPWIYDLIALLALVAYIFYISTFLFVTPMRRYMREELHARGVPICGHCGYDLRGQTEQRCPECGQDS